jgi:hypothetical protein
MSSFPGETDDFGYHLIAIEQIDSQLYQILVRMSSLTQIADEAYVQSKPSPLLIEILTLGRNEIQHDLLSNPTSQYGPLDFVPTTPLDRSPPNPRSIPTPIPQLALIELIRLTACIYSDLVLYPLAWSTGVKARLSTRLRMILLSTTPRLPSQCPADTNLRTWILWYGTLASFTSAHQDWFENELYFHLQMVYGLDFGDRGIGYETVRGVLKGFLWWDHICEQPSRNLWERILLSRRI